MFERASVRRDLAGLSRSRRLREIKGRRACGISTEAPKTLDAKLLARSSDPQSDVSGRPLRIIVVPMPVVMMVPPMVMMIPPVVVMVPPVMVVVMMMMMVVVMVMIGLGMRMLKLIRGHPRLVARTVGERPLVLGS